MFTKNNKNLKCNRGQYDLIDAGVPLPQNDLDQSLRLISPRNKPVLPGGVKSQVVQGAGPTNAVGQAGLDRTAGLRHGARN